ncbi:divergent polysaccharide deacetylase family protein [Roseomonas sp. BN140053]|uniref:divergent polysaccharide deacetylase family protein n=1 Tax=Roseomonas sp. BN140053 TaxID=3391898 RepID=UPI0039E781D8
MGARSAQPGPHPDGGAADDATPPGEPDGAAPRRHPGWRRLGWFWLAVLLILGAGAGTLAYLGPPVREDASLAAASAAAEEPPNTLPPAVPAPEPVAALPAPAAPPPVPAETAAASAVAAPPAPLPAAPLPPPLPAPRPPGVVAGPIPPPDPALLDATRYGTLPRVGTDGRTSIRAYARAFARDDTRPRIGLVVGGLGLNAALSEEAIRRLPAATALAFSPYALRPEPLAERARARGMELLIALPLEPAGFPMNDPGEQALLTTRTPAENADRLGWVLSRLQGYVGAVGALGPMRGERFAQIPAMLGEVQDVLRDRGLLYLDPRPGLPPGTPNRAWGRNADLVLDEPATRGEIERRLAELERLAIERGSALGLAGDVSPVLVDRVAAWAAALETRGLVLAPVTALIRRPEGRGDARPEGRGEARSEGRGDARPDGRGEARLEGRP